MKQPELQSQPELRSQTEGPSQAGRHPLGEAKFSRITVTFADVSFPFVYGCGAIRTLTDALKSINPDCVIIVADRQAWSLHSETILPAAGDAVPTSVLLVESGEQSKTLRQLDSLSERVLKCGATRASLILAVGGGVVGNLAGLLAALLFRGIHLAHIPTTFLAMHDSVISLKQAVSTWGAKNILGTFYTPAFVIADLQFLSTLSQEEMRSGLCELIKNALVIAPEGIGWLSRVMRTNYWDRMDVLEEMLLFGVKSKMRVMGNDKYEREGALVLEYGHTVGHALERLLSNTAGHPPLRHGEAVAIGMLAAARISEELGLADARLTEQHYELIRAAGVQERIPAGLRAREVMEYVRLDNKRGYLDMNANETAMILLGRPGCPLETKGKPLKAVPYDTLIKVLETLES